MSEQIKPQKDDDKNCLCTLYGLAWHGLTDEQKSRIVWDDALSDPAFREASQRGIEALNEGRTIRVEIEDL